MRCSFAHAKLFDVRSFIALLIVTFGVAHAQPAPLGVLALIPLDSRPATATLPPEIAGVAGVRVLVPPMDLLGNATRAADTPKLLNWLAATSVSAAVVALDALIYGGLVQSRSSPLSTEEALARLMPLVDWHARSRVPLHAFITIPRAPDATDRARNLAVIMRLLDWAADGTFARLYVTWDDALPGSPAPLEGAQVREAAEARGLSNVLVYPGADEVASVLIARLALEAAQVKPTVKLEFSLPEMSEQISQYDGLPLSQSAGSQARAVGWEVVQSRADLTLFVFNGGDRRSAALRLSSLARRGPVALADVFDVNKAASRLIEDTVTLQRYFGLYAFSAWGTPGNNLGTALAHAAMRLLGGDSLAQVNLLLREYVNDYLYATIVRPQVREELADQALEGNSVRTKLLELLRSAFKPARLERLYCLQIISADFPWARSFEVRVEVSAIPRAAGDPNCPR